MERANGIGSGGKEERRVSPSLRMWRKQRISVSQARVSTMKERGRIFATDLGISCGRLLQMFEH